MEECILDWDASDGCLLREGLSPVLTVCSSSARLGSWPGVPFVGEGPVAPQCTHSEWKAGGHFVSRAKRRLPASSRAVGLRTNMG